VTALSWHLLCFEQVLGLFVPAPLQFHLCRLPRLSLCCLVRRLCHLPATPIVPAGALHHRGRSVCAGACCACCGGHGN
jgi:hypothetical protein